MIIFVKTLYNKTITLEVDRNQTIEDTKVLIQEKESIPMEQQNLLIAGMQKILDITLDDQSTLRQYGIQNGDLLHLISPGYSSISVLIKILAGRNFKLKVIPFDTVESLKLEIQRCTQIPPFKQSLFVIGEQRNNKYLINMNATLISYNIHNGSTIHLEVCESVQIIVERLNGKTFAVEVDALDTIDELKKKIHEKEGILPEDQDLFYAGSKIDVGIGNKKLVDYGPLSQAINQQRSIILLASDGKGKQLIRILVKISKIPGIAKKIDIIVKPSDTIENVKLKIHAQTGITPDKLVFHL